MPIVIAPMTWLRAVFGFRMRPAAHTASIRRTRTSPVALCTPTSTKCPAKVDCWYSLLSVPNSMLSSAVSLPPAVASCSVALRDAVGNLTVGKLRLLRIKPDCRGNHFAKLHTGGVNAGGGGIRAPLSTRTRRNRETGIAEVNRNLLQRYAKHFRCRLGQNGVAAGRQCRSCPFPL